MQRIERGCCKQCNGRLIGRRIKRPPGRSSYWSAHYARLICLPSEQRPLDGSYMRKATVSKRTAPGATRAMHYANAKMESTACAIPIPRKKTVGAILASER